MATGIGSFGKFGGGIVGLGSLADERVESQSGSPITALG